MFSVYIYNKGPRIADKAVRDRASCIHDCPNVGRESETYLRHILYSSRIADAYTVFCQGNPFEHSPDFTELLAVWARWKDIQPLSWSYIREREIPPPHILVEECYDFVSGLRVRKEYYSLYTMAPVQFTDHGALQISVRYRSEHGLSMGANLVAHFLDSCGLSTVADRANKHFAGCFAYGAIFAVRNRLFDSVTLEAFSRAWQLSTSHEIHGWMLERIWLHLWGEPFLFPRSVK
jgi:hypothetical protein